jgi:hypothetical protein
VGCPESWQAVADDVLKALRTEPPPPDADVQKVRLRRYFRRARRGRKGQLPDKDQVFSGLLGLRSSKAQDLPPGVTDALPGFFLADVPQACDNGLAPEPKLALQLGVDDVVCFGDFASDEQRMDFWGVYRLFEERLVLLFDQGRSVLAVGPPAVLTCLLHGVLVRCWQFTAQDTLDYIKHLGRKTTDLPGTFLERCKDVPNNRVTFARERPSVLVALRQHFRLLEESQRWPLHRTEPLVRTTEALLARSLGWDLRRHDGLSIGASCLAVLRSIRSELESLQDRSFTTTWNKIACVRWCVGKHSATEEGLIVEGEGPATNGDAVRLADELVLELEDVSRAPQMLVLALEGQRPIAIQEGVDLQLQAHYFVYALATSSCIVTRAEGTAVQALPGTSVHDNALVIRPPVALVLMQKKGLADSRISLRPWPQFLESCVQVVQVPAQISSQQFQLRLANLSQYDNARRSRRLSAWKEVDAVGEIFDFPADARIEALQKKLAARLQIPVSWQIILAPVENRGGLAWRFLLPNASIIDHAVNVGDGPLVLVLSVQKDASQLLQRNPQLYQQPATTYLSFPWMPVLCLACLERQIIPLDTLLFDARRTLASYAGRVAWRVEEEMGPRAYCTAFAVYEYTAAASNSKSTWRPLQMGTPIAAELQQPGQGSNGSEELTVLLWEVLPLAPSMTGRGWFAAQEAACLPDPNATEKLFPLERLATRKTEEIGLALQLPGQDQGSSAAWSDAEEYASLLILEERLLVSWVEDSAEAIGEIMVEARRRIDAMVARLAKLAPADAPPGLKEWPTEHIQQWSTRTWEKICRGSSSLQVWASPGPDATEEEVMRSLLWAEVSTLQEIVLSMDAIRFSRQGRVFLGSTLQQPTGKLGKEGRVQVAHLGATVSDVVEAERTYYSTLLGGTDLDDFFSCEVEDLPSECDPDIGCLHAFVQTTNAELNSVWLTQRHQILASGEASTEDAHKQSPNPEREAQMWRIVRLRELALSALFLLLKQAQGTKLLDGVFLEWLQEVQQGCRTVIQKSKILCEAASAVAGLPGGGETAITEAVEQLGVRLDEASNCLEALHQSAAKKKVDAAEVKHAEEQLASCDMHTLFGNLALLALERQSEASVKSPSRRLVSAMRRVRQGLHSLTLKTMLIRARFDLPLDDASATFNMESQRRGRKMRVLGRNPRRPVNAPTPQATGGTTLSEKEAKMEGDAAEAKAQAEAQALMESEEQAKVKKMTKKKKDKVKRDAKRSAANHMPSTSIESEVKGSPASPSAVSEAVDEECKVDSPDVPSLQNGQSCESIFSDIATQGKQTHEGKKVDDVRMQTPPRSPLRVVSEPEEEAAPDGVVRSLDEEEEV